MKDKDILKHLLELKILSDEQDIPEEFDEDGELLCGCPSCVAFREAEASTICKDFDVYPLNIDSYVIVDVEGEQVCVHKDFVEFL